MMRRLAAAVVAASWFATFATYATESDSAGAIAGPATPAGVTLMHVRFKSGPDVPGRMVPDHLVLGSADNQTLYFSDGDTRPDSSSCYGECAKIWIPFHAAGGAQHLGAWSIIKRHDGSEQWAFRGRPLYTYVKDTPAFSSTALDVHGKSKGGSPALGADVEGHHVYELKVGEWMSLPPGILVSEVLSAPGQVLTNSKGMPLYAFASKARYIDAARVWIPFTAPTAALPVGDFKIVGHHDGISQWAYKGKPLYLYSGDLKVGDSNGNGVDSRFRLVTIFSYFLPPDVVIKKDERRGGVFINSRTGTPIYARDRITYGTGGNHNSRGSEDSRGDPAVGKGLGLVGCDARCEQTWIPLRAQPTAQPSGYWTIVDRPDGTKQWAYQGFPVYTYAKDKPHDVKAYDAYAGHDEFDFVVNNDTEHPEPDILGNGLYWRVVFP